MEAGDYTAAFPNLSDIDGSSLYVYGGGSLSLPAVDTYSNNDGGRYFQAYEPDTPYGQTPTVGVLSLPNLASIGGDYGVQVECAGAAARSTTCPTSLRSCRERFGLFRTKRHR